MSTPINTEDLNPENLRQAIKQIQEELPGLLGSDYLSFSSELEIVMSEGSNDKLLALIATYPAVYDRLQEFLNFFSAGHGLYGDSISIKPAIRYICPVGSHFVDETDVQKRDVIGRPLCPRHGKPMNLAP